MRNVTGRKAELLKAFEVAKSIDKKLNLFKRIEKLIPESDLGVECWILANYLFHQRHSLEQVISFGSRALRIFISNNNSDDIPFVGKLSSGVTVGIGEIRCEVKHNSSFYIACVCHLLASASFNLKRYDACLNYANWANRNFTKLLDNDDCVNHCVSNAVVGIQGLLFQVKMDMGGKGEDVVVHAKKSLELSEKIMEEGCVEIGHAYKRLLIAYVMLMNYKEALRCCLKALEIYMKHLGSSSVEVLNMMRELVTLYSELGEHEKALKQNQQLQVILKNTTPDSPEFLNGEFKNGCILIELGRYEEAFVICKGVASHTNTDLSIRGPAFLNMAVALANLGKRVEAKKHMLSAQNTFEKKAMEPVASAMGLEYISRMYEKMNEFGEATTALRRALSIPEIPLKLLAEGSARLFTLIFLSDNEKEGIPYMEDVVEKLKEKFGAQHCEVGYGYRNLGAAYLKSGQEELAVKFLAKAKNLLDVALGPCHLESLKTSQTLAVTCATLRSYDLAVDIQEKVVKGLKRLGPTGQEKLNVAITLLKKMEVATVAGSVDFHAKN